MRGLIDIPTATKLKYAYNKMQHKTITAKKLALFTQWARLDPRLAEILVGYLATNWKTLSPVEINHYLRSHPWPVSIGVILEYVLLVIPKSETSLLKKWGSIATDGFPKNNYENYFFGQRSFGSKLLIDDAKKTNKLYLKWGFLGYDNLTRSNIHNKTLLSKKKREESLRELLKLKRRIRVKDYIQFLGGQVSKRQAELDLKNSKLLKSSGKTKGLTYTG